MPGPSAMNIPNLVGSPTGRGFFGSGAPGSGAQTGGMNAALNMGQNAVNASADTTSAQRMQLGQQLQQQQGALQQNMMSRGLANTSAAMNMNQAPIQSYNLGMAQVGDLNAMRQMGAYQNLAGLYAGGGNAITNTAQPYAQTNFVQGKMQGLFGHQPQIISAPPMQGFGGQGGQGEMQQQGVAANDPNAINQAAMLQYQNFMNGQGYGGSNPNQQTYQDPFMQDATSPDMSGSFADSGD